jgi:hypothetical protein
LSALEKLERTHHRLAKRNQNILQESFSHTFDDPELIEYKASQRFKGNFNLPNDSSMM